MTTKRHETKLEKRGLNEIKYIAVCSCGWRGPIREFESAAEDDAMNHTVGESL